MSAARTAVGGHGASAYAHVCASGAESLELGHRLCRALSSRPDGDLLCQALALSFPARFRAGAALVAQVRGDGNLHVVGQFGYSPRKQFPDVIPLSDDWPIVEAVRSQEPLVLPTAAAVVERFPGLDRPDHRIRPLVATSLASQGSPVGVAVVSFERDVDDPRAATVLAGILRDIVGLYVGLQWAEPEAATAYAGRAGRRADDEELTPRQLTILHLLADGLSKGEIAFRIGYSESTVRQETLALYRSFGVGDRHACVAAARARSILVAPDDLSA